MKKKVAIIGGGSSALLLAAFLDKEKFDATIYERNAALGRKFLVAGDGGLNITHSEPIEQFIQRYIPSDFFKPIIQQFSNSDLVQWLNTIGIETFIGTSGRIFPDKNIKPIDVLNAIINELKKKNISTKTKHIWNGWSENNELIFKNEASNFALKADIVVFALGGKSWSITGSDGNWTNYFTEKNINTIPFSASNCAVKIDWNDEFLKFNEGEFLKNISIKCGDKEKKGEVVITKFGLEGGAIYALNAPIRNQLNQNQEAKINIDLKPIYSHDDVLEKLNQPKRNSWSNHLATKIGLNKTAIDLLKFYLSKEDFTNTNSLAKAIKNFPIKVTSLAPIDEAISTVGGISLQEINSNFELKKLPNHFCIGEMLDWDAPTGGYLLQGNFSMGHQLAKYLNSISQSNS
jgi:uncharacterized flavoprotein (TIGR03862 family)